MSLEELEARQDPTIEIKRLLGEGNAEGAFTKALETQNVEVVTWLCKAADLANLLGNHEGGDNPPLSRGVPAGGSVVFMLRLGVGAVNPGGTHCLRIEIKDASGKPRPDYVRKVLMTTGNTRVALPLALNDPAGDWQVRVTDVTTGRTGTALFRVTPVRFH